MKWDACLHPRGFVRRSMNNICGFRALKGIVTWRVLALQDANEPPSSLSGLPKEMKKYYTLHHWMREKKQLSAHSTLQIYEISGYWFRGGWHVFIDIFGEHPHDERSVSGRCPTLSHDPGYNKKKKQPENPNQPEQVMIRDSLLPIIYYLFLSACLIDLSPSTRQPSINFQRPHSQQQLFHVVKNGILQQALVLENPQTRDEILLGSNVPLVHLGLIPYKWAERLSIGLRLRMFI